MKDGGIVAQGTPEEVVTAERLHEVFGLAAHVTTEPTDGRPHVIPLGAGPLHPATPLGAGTRTS
jgi:iron complex transport system ATP-binding protein